jgi:hypothetical protein
MPSNLYFNNFPKNITSEQLLVEDLVIESLKIHGMDVYYMPRTSRDQVDYIFGEDTLKQYVAAYPLEMYLENVTGMEGEGDFISKFGLEIRDEIQLLVSRRRFAASVPQIRPNEGDLIYVPLVQNFFEITFVEHENDQAMFYTLGRGRGGNVYVYGLKLKQFVFSNEIIETGITEIDEQIRNEYPRTKITISAGSGTYVNDEFVYVGANLASATAQALVHDFVPNTYLEVYRTIGTFGSGTLIGNTSNAQWTISTVDTMTVKNTAFEDIQDNARIQAESDGIIDWTETNPFGGD